MLMLIAYHGVAFVMICQGTYVFQEAGQPVRAGSPERVRDAKGDLVWGCAMASYGYLAVLLGLISCVDADFSIVLNPVMTVGLGGWVAYGLCVLFGNRRA